MGTSFFLVGFIAWAVFFSHAAVEGCVVNVRNNCPYRVTACSQSQLQNIVQYNLGAGGSATINLGAACWWPAAVVYASVTGRCADPGNPSAATDRNLANLAEFTIGANHLDFYDINNVGLRGPGSNGIDFYDLSNVNAYTIGLAIRPSNPSGGNCRSISCTIPNIQGFCQPNNRLVVHPTTALSCINTDGTEGRGPTAGTRQFKTACPDAYSYNFDDATSTFTCNNGVDYNVIFCP